MITQNLFNATCDYLKRVKKLSDGHVQALVKEAEESKMPSMIEFGFFPSVDDGVKRAKCFFRIVKNWKDTTEDQTTLKFQKEVWRFLTANKEVPLGLGNSNHLRGCLQEAFAKALGINNEQIAVEAEHELAPLSGESITPGRFGAIYNLVQEKLYTVNFELTPIKMGPGASAS